jgi:hypothetical protein
MRASVREARGLRRGFLWVVLISEKNRLSSIASGSILVCYVTSSSPSSESGFGLQRRYCPARPGGSIGPSRSCDVCGGSSDSTAREVTFRVAPDGATHRAALSELPSGSSMSLSASRALRNSGTSGHTRCMDVMHCTDGMCPDITVHTMHGRDAP